MQCHPCRKCLSSLIFSKQIDEIESWKYYLLTYSILGCSFIIAMIVTDLGIILELVSATGSCMISYILPGIYIYIYNYIYFFVCFFYIKRYILLFYEKSKITI